MSKNLEEMTLEVLRIFKEYASTGTKPWTAEIAAKDLSYQVGSLTKAMMQRMGERYSEGKSDEELKTQIADELADILAEVLFISHELRIDLGEAWIKMIESDEKKINSRQNK